MKTLPLSMLSVLLLGACGAPEQEPAPAPSPMAEPTGPRTLIAAGFDEQQLGPKIEGPQGPQVLSDVSFEGQPVAEMVSYVACPAADGDAVAKESCIPGEQAEGAIFTYVHRVTVTGDDTQMHPFTFRTTRAATGFANVIGYDRDQAAATLGEGYSIGVQTENGALIWRIEAGDGWTKGEELTFFWQSTSPPEGPSEAFELESPTGGAPLTGPFPPAEIEDEANAAPQPD